MSRPPHPHSLPRKAPTLAEFFGRLSIRRKLSLAFGIEALLTMTVCITAIVTNAVIDVQVQQINKAAVDKAEGVSSMAEALRNLRWHRAEWLLNHARLTAGVEGNGAKISQDLVDDLHVFQAEGIAACRDSAQYAITSGQRYGQAQVVDEARLELAMLDGIARKFTVLDSDLRAAVAPGLGQPRVNLADTRIDRAFDEVDVMVEAYEAQMKAQDKHQALQVAQDLRWTNHIFILFAALVVILNTLLTVFLSRIISRPLEKLKDAARQIGQGKLDGVIELPSKDEFGLLAGALNQTRADLRSTTVSKDYFDSILKSMSNTLIVLRPDFTVRSANRSALDLLDYDSFDLIDQPMSAVLKDLGTRALPVLTELEQKGGVTEVEVQYLTRDGRALPMTFSASTLRDFSGLVSGYICVAQDISERKHSEEQLAAANRSLLESSRQAGMAEVATSVLHNVGNVLNSVNVSTTLIADKVNSSRMAGLGKAIALIEQHQADLARFFKDDPKGRQLPGYLSKLSAHLLAEKKEIVEEASQLVKNVLHIRDIITVQQNYARVSGVTEMLNPHELIEDAVRINVGALERHQVKLERQYAELPSFPIDKHKVLQILVNLIRNAKYACDDSGREDRQIILRTGLEDGAITISVIDNGVGIPAENLKRIFSLGFTTRREGHGFGLHSGVLAAQEMGGSLAAFSDGPGCGATFTLKLPLPPPDHEI